MQFIYLGEARLYEERMSEFLIVSKNLEIKELSTGIELNDQTTSDHVESNDNNVADKVTDIAGVPSHATHENGGNVEPQAQTEPITPNNTANRRVRRSGVVSGEAKVQCKDCERTFSSQPGLWHHTQSKHEGVKYACNQCEYQGSRDAIRHHIKIKHP